MTPEERLVELGIVLPSPPKAVATYVPWIITGNLIVTSGQLPFRDGTIVFPGRLGTEFTVEEGYAAARICTLNAIAQLKSATVDLSRIQQIVRLDGMVHSAPGFRGQPAVLNGASELLYQVFGEKGAHTRTAVGISEMPLDAAVQVSIVAEIGDQLVPGSTQ